MVREYTTLNPNRITMVREYTTLNPNPKQNYDGARVHKCNDHDYLHRGRQSAVPAGWLLKGSSIHPDCVGIKRPASRDFLRPRESALGRFYSSLAADRHDPLVQQHYFGEHHDPLGCGGRRNGDYRLPDPFPGTASHTQHSTRNTQQGTDISEFSSGITLWHRAKLFGGNE
jgi:hypothetical protein